MLFNGWMTEKPRLRAFHWILVAGVALLVLGGVLSAQGYASGAIALLLGIVLAIAGLIGVVVRSAVRRP